MFDRTIRLSEFLHSHAELLPLKEYTGQSRLSWSHVCTAINGDDELLVQICQLLLAVKADCMDAEDGDEGSEFQMMEANVFQQILTTVMSCRQRMLILITKCTVRRCNMPTRCTIDAVKCSVRLFYLVADLLLLLFSIFNS
jgi:hypothetical protein